MFIIINQVRYKLVTFETYINGELYHSTHIRHTILRVYFYRRIDKLCYIRPALLQEKVLRIFAEANIVMQKKKIVFFLQGHKLFQNSSMPASVYIEIFF